MNRSLRVHFCLIQTNPVVNMYVVSREMGGDQEGDFVGELSNQRR